MSAGIQKLWPLYFGKDDDEFGCTDDTYSPDNPRLVAIETFVDMFMEVRADSVLMLLFSLILVF